MYSENIWGEYLSVAARGNMAALNNKNHSRGKPRSRPSIKLKE